MSQLVRSPDVLLRLAEGFDVANNFAFLPHRRLIPWVPGDPTPIIINGTSYKITPLLTLCNAYVAVFSAALGCPIPPMKANDQKVWLESNEGKMAGWFGVNRQLAMERAKLGYPTVAIAIEQPHGHVGMVMPKRMSTDSDALYVSAAGLSNYWHVLMSRSFGHLDPAALFFTHN